MLAKDKNDKTLVTKSTNECVFKKPLGPVPQRRRKILDEDAYLKKLGKIIERDFFPDLLELPDKLEFLKASEANDVDRLNVLYSKYNENFLSKSQRSVDSPATFDTPERLHSCYRDQTSSNNSLMPPSKSSQASDDDSLTLDNFMNSYTSEDNESFKSLIKIEEVKHRLKHAWVFDAEQKHNSEHVPNLALPSLAEQKMSKILSITNVAEKEKDTRPTSLENWNYKTFNSVMFVPDGAEPCRVEAVEAAERKEKEICHENTRFDEIPFKEATLRETSVFQALKNEGKIGVDGKEISNTPKVNGYSFVTAPSPHPGVDSSPLMTWGQVDSTPCALDGSQTPLLKDKSLGPSYKMPLISKRDELLLKLSEKHNRNNRDRKAKAFSVAKSNLYSPYVSSRQMSNLERQATMSPAAQKLLSSKMGIRKGIDRSLRASYTPSTSPFTPSGSARSFVSKTSSTPLGSRSSRTSKRASTPSTPLEGLTDNLLHFAKDPKTPDFKAKRKCAADFF